MIEGAGYNYQDDAGQTALIVALINGNLNIANDLI